MNEKKKWADDGQPVPEGFHAESTTDVSKLLITGAMAAREGLLDIPEMDALFTSVEKSVEANSPELTAALMMAIATLAAGAYSQLADLTKTSPITLLNTDAAMNDLIARLGRKL